jgi:DNA/RNA endonuclease G (NUC1)
MAKLPKKPKAPKGGLGKASVKSLEAYEGRLKDWQAKCKAIEKEESSKVSLIKKVEALAKKK